MADEPLIFVEVALTRGLADSITPFVEGSEGASGRPDPSWLTADESEATTAVFYSISNCHRGLAGVSLGDFLIKSVVESLTDEPATSIDNFVTLSPLPGFRGWLLNELDRSGNVLATDEAALTAPGRPEAQADLYQLVAGPLPEPDDERLERFRGALMRLAACYIVTERRSDGLRSVDPVAHFHLTNGAKAEQLNWMANPTQTGWERGLSMMINYRYELGSIERNHDRYVTEGIVVASDQLNELRKPTR